MFEQDFRKPIDMKDWNVWLCRKDRDYTLIQTGEGLRLETRTWDSVVPGDSRWYDRFRGAAYKVRAHIGRMGLAPGEGEEGFTNRYRIIFRVDQVTRQHGWLAITESHVQEHVNNSVYPHGSTLQISVNDRRRLQFYYGLRPKWKRTIFDAPDLGEWCDITIEVKWSTGQDGWGKCYLGDKLVAERLGPNMPTPDTMEWKGFIYTGNNVRTPTVVTVQYFSVEVL